MPHAEDKHAIYERAQFGHKLGYGKHPALVVIDFQIGFTKPELSPLAGHLDRKSRRLYIDRRSEEKPPVIFTV